MPFFDDNPEAVAPRSLQPPAPPKREEAPTPATPPTQSVAQRLLSRAHPLGAILPPDNGLLDAAFRQNNTIVSSYNFLAERAGLTPDPEHNPIDLIGGTGYEANYLHRFVDSVSEADTRARMSRIDREENDRKLLDASGFAGFVAQAAGAIIDPTMFIPLGHIVRGARAGRPALATGAATGAVVAGQEAILYGTHELATPAESTLNVATGTILGGILGGAIAKLSAREVARLTDVFDGYRAEVNAELVSGAPAPAGAATAQREGLTLAPALGLETAIAKLSPVTRLQTSPFEASRAAIRDTADAGLSYRENLDGIPTSEGGTVETRVKMRRGPMIDTFSAMDDAYARYKFDKSSSSFLERSAITGPAWALVTGQGGGKLSAREFREEIGKAMRRGDQHPIPQIAEAAKLFRAKVFDPLKDEAVRLGLLKDISEAPAAAPKLPTEDLEALTTARNNELEQVTTRYLAAKVGEKPEAQARLKTWFDKEVELIHSDFERKSGLLRRPTREPSKVATVGAESYLTRVYNREMIVARRDEWLNILTDWMSRKRAADATSFEQTKAARVAKLEEELAAFGPARATPDKPAELKAFDAARAEDLVTLRAPLDQELDLLAHARDRDLEQAKSIYRQRSAIANKQERVTLKAKLAEADARIALAHADAVKKAEKQFAPMLRQFKKAVGAERTRVASQLSAEASAADRHASLVERIAKAKAKQPNEDALISRSDAELRSLAEEVTNTILGEPVLRLPGMSMLHGPKGPLKARVLRIPDAAIEDFLESDIEKVARVYTQSMSGDIELKAKFGDINMGEQFSRLLDEFNAKSRALPAGAEAQQRALQKRYNDDVRDLSALRDRIRGTYQAPSDPDGLMYRAGRMALNLNYVSRLGGVTISSLPDIARPIMRYGLNAFRDGWIPLIKSFSTAKLAMREVRLAGTALEMVRDQRALELADLLDDYGRNSKFERGVQYMADRFSTLNLMAPWNGGIKSLTGIITMAEALRSTRALALGKASADEIGRLAENGIDEAMARRIWVQAEETGNDIDGIFLPNTEDWTDIKAVESFRALINREVDNLIVTPGLERPLWISHPVGRILGQFKTFALVSTQRVTLAGLQQRDARVLSGVLVALSVGAFSAHIKARLASKDTSKWTEEQWVAEALDNSGLLGVFNEANAMAEKFSRGKVGLSVITGKQVSRFQSRDVAGTIGGPSIELIQGATAAVRGGSALAYGAVGAGEADDWTAADTKALRRIAPFQNLMYVRKLFDMMESGANEALGVKEKRR